MSLARRRFLTGMGLAAGAAAVGTGTAAATGRQPVNPWDGHDRWYAGDHHIHTQYSPDAQYEVATQVAKARVRPGLAGDHRPRRAWRTRSSRSTRSRRTSSVRGAATGTCWYQGLEWNIPGAEHATVFLPPGRHTVDILKAFEAAYDGGVLSTPVDR